VKPQIKSPATLVTAGLIFVGCKLYFPLANFAFFTFLLWPVAQITGTVIGLPMDYLPGTGYYFSNYNVLIDKSCSGYNFLLLSFMIFVFFLTLKLKTRIPAFWTISISLFLSYVLTLLANTSRILISMLFTKNSFFFEWVDSRILHESIGVFCFLSFVIVATLILDNFLSGSQKNVETT